MRKTVKTEPKIREIELLDSFQYLTRLEDRIEPYIDMVKETLSATEMEKISNQLDDVEIDYSYKMPYTSGLYMIPELHTDNFELSEFLMSIYSTQDLYMANIHLINFYISYVFFKYSYPVIMTSQYYNAVKMINNIGALFEEYEYLYFKSWSDPVDKVETVYNYYKSINIEKLTSNMAQVDAYLRGFLPLNDITISEWRLSTMYKELIELLVEGPLKFNMEILTKALNKLYAHDSIKLHNMSMECTDKLFGVYIDELLNILKNNSSIRDESMYELSNAVENTRRIIRGDNLFSQLTSMYSSTDD